MLTQQEFEAILTDASKRIEGDVFWISDEDHSPAREFRAEIRSDLGHSLFPVGWYNQASEKLNYTIVHREYGRIYALNLGASHRNPDNELVGDKHKHYWSERGRDRVAYVPDDITEPWHNPVGVWQQFCREASLRHQGIMRSPPPLPGEG
jgi:hypothetical protein